MVAAHQQKQRRRDVVFVLAKNWDDLQAFLSVQTQLDSNGFNYAGLEAGLRMAGIECPPVLFQKLRVIEFAALAGLVEQ